MASSIHIYSIYKVKNENLYYLLKAERPGYSNTSQAEQEQAGNIEQEKRIHILKYLGQKHKGTPALTFDFIGELQGFPIGDKLYTEYGDTNVSIYYMQTEYGMPWIVLGHANSEAEFLDELHNDEDLLGLKPLGQPQHIHVTFVTEKDLDI